MDKIIEDQVVAMYTSKDSRGRKIPVQNICLELGIHAPDVYMVLRKYEIGFRRNHSASGKGTRIVAKYPDAVRDLIVRMAKSESHPTAMEISVALGIRYQHVLLVLNTEGIRMPHGARRRDPGLVAEVQERLEGGMNIEMVAADLGVTTAAVANVMGLMDIGSGLPGVEREAEIASLTAEVLKRVKHEIDKI